MRSALLAVAVCALLGAAVARAADSLVFGDQWDDFYRQLSTEEPQWIAPGWRDLITLPPPPDHEFTRIEVGHIIALKRLRRRYQEQIEAQIDDIIRPFTISLGLDREQAAALGAFWESLAADVTRVHMFFKAKFDRARPRQYSRKVAPSIDPPGHPAYPSGHSTDAHTLALLLADVWPEKKTHLLSIAYQIALNREIAGVHYRSDTAAGYLLAQQIVALLADNPEAKSAMAALNAALAP